MGILIFHSDTFNSFSSEFAAVETTIVRDPWVKPLTPPTLAIVQCDVDGKPAPSVSWEKIDGVSSPSYTAQDGVLVFTSLRADVDSGLYVCNATNGYTDDLSYMAGRNLTVCSILRPRVIENSSSS